MYINTNLIFATTAISYCASLFIIYFISIYHFSRVKINPIHSHYFFLFNIEMMDGIS